MCMMNPKSALVIFHRSDYDGTISRDVVTHWLRRDAQCVIGSVGWDYGDPVPDITGWEVVYLVDISIPEILVPENQSRVVWIDHHKTAIERFGNAWKGYRIDGVAACRLCWQWFQAHHRGERLPAKEDYINRVVQEPELVRLAGEYDIWDRRDARAEVLQYGLRASATHDLIGYLEAYVYGRDTSGYVNDLISAGALARQYAREMDRVVMGRSYHIKWEGLRWLVVNTAVGNSLTFASGNVVAQALGVDGLLMWRWDGAKMKVSLYHAPGHEDRDLSEIAKRYGGGGHPGACGFESLFILPQLLTAV